MLLSNQSRYASRLGEKTQLNLEKMMTLYIDEALLFRCDGRIHNAFFEERDKRDRVGIDKKKKTNNTRVK